MADYLGKKIKFNIEDNDLQKIRFNKAYGESQQATRSGKNHFDASQIPSSTNIVVSDNGKTITMPIATSGGGATPTTKKLSQLCPKLKVGDTATLRFNRNLGTTKNMYIYLNVVNLVWNINSPKAITQEMLDSYVSLFANRYDEGETGQCILTDFSIMLSSETDTSWEQYGVMPSPDYLSKIENLEGKNLFDENKSEWGKYNLWQHNTGNYANAFVNVINIKGLDKCSISFKNNTRTFRFGYQFIDDNENYLSGLYWSTSTNEKIVANISVPENASKIIISQLDGQKEDDIKIQLEKGTVATPYVPYNSLEIKDVGKNLYTKKDISGTRMVEVNINELTVGTYTLSAVATSSDTDRTQCLVYDATNNKNLGYLNRNVRSSFTFTLKKPTKKLNFYASINYSLGENDTFKFADIQIEQGTTATLYKPYQEQKVDFPLSEGQKLMEGSYLADDGIHHRRKQVVLDGTENWALTSTDNQVLTKRFSANITSNMKVGSANTALSTHFSVTENATEDKESMYFTALGTVTYIALRISVDKATTVEQLKIYLATEYANGTPVIVEYELAEEEIVPYTEEQQEAREKLRHFKGLNGENNITAQGTMTSTLDLTLYNVAEEDFDIYISKKGYFGALKYDINNLIDFMESNIPSIAEATESSVKIAGRDGDIPLNTVYEPLPFEIVCYTEDNLTPEEKIIEEQKITSLLNSIKNQTKTFFMEREKKFYKVKYSGNLSVVRYPKHLKFTIPLKSSESYAMNFEESEIIGNGTKVSNTIKDTGAIFTIKGPAIKPIISLNNYQMKYNENILEGNSLIINSEDSTITHITSAGVKTNAMRAYNHEFPKIKNGENQLAVSSGIDDEKQVNVKWYDLKI